MVDDASRPEREEEPRIFSSNPPGACPVPGDLLPFEVALEELKSSRKRFFLFAPSATPLIGSPERGGGPPGTGPGTETPERRGRPSWRGWDFLRRREQGLGGAAAGAGPAEAGSREGAPSANPSLEPPQKREVADPRHAQGFSEN